MMAKFTPSGLLPSLLCLEKFQKDLSRSQTTDKPENEAAALDTLSLHLYEFECNPILNT